MREEEKNDQEDHVDFYCAYAMQLLYIEGIAKLRKDPSHPDPAGIGMSGMPDMPGSEFDS